MNKRMIFHHPEPLNPLGNSGSQIRPIQMITAFRDLGYEIDVVTGYANERKEAIRNILHNIESGLHYDFLYAESSTTPMILTEPNHLPSHPLLDFAFFGKLKNRHIASGIFYRDIHWRYSSYSQATNILQRSVTIPAYKHEWWSYCRLFDRLYLPSLAMQNALPTRWSSDRVTVLPPGCISNNIKHCHNNQIFNLLYVGGIKPPIYDLTPIIENMHQLKDITLTICCRDSEWREMSSIYNIGDQTNIRIVHARGDELDQLYQDADLFVFIRQPDPYLNFAMPIKIVESIGYGLPIITSSDGEAARFVEQERVGWTVNDQHQFIDLIRYLQNNPGILGLMYDQVNRVRAKHTWTKRAQLVIKTLTSLKGTVVDENSITSCR